MEISIVTSGEPAKIQVFVGERIVFIRRGNFQCARCSEHQDRVQGPCQDGQRVGFAFIVENPNANVTVENSEYQATAYAKDGSVLTSDDGYIDLLPGQKLGIAGDMSLSDDNVVIDHFDVQVKPGKFTPAQPQPLFTTDKATFIKDDYSSKVTGIIKSAYKNDTSQVRASAVAYDDKGGIIGGGYTYVDFVLAGDQTGVSISTVASSTPAKVEIYAAVSGLSQFGTTSSQSYTGRQVGGVRIRARGFAGRLWLPGREHKRQCCGRKEPVSGNGLCEGWYRPLHRLGLHRLALLSQKLGIAGNMSIPERMPSSITWSYRSKQATPNCPSRSRPSHPTKNLPERIEHTEGYWRDQEPIQERRLPTSSECPGV